MQKGRRIRITAGGQEAGAYAAVPSPDLGRAPLSTPGVLVLHAWWFNLTEGQLYAFNPEAATFDPVKGIEVAPTVQQGTRLSAIKPERLLLALANRKPAF